MDSLCKKGEKCTGKHEIHVDDTGGRRRGKKNTQLVIDAGKDMIDVRRGACSGRRVTRKVTRVSEDQKVLECF